MLHVCKYSDKYVCGLLIGTNDNKIAINEIVPVCHFAPVGPIFDIAAEVVWTLYDCYVILW